MFQNLKIAANSLYADDMDLNFRVINCTEKSKEDLYI